MPSIVSILLTFFFLTITFCLVSLSSAFRRLHKQDTLAELKRIKNLFIYQRIHRYFFSKNEYEGLFFSIIFSQHISRLLYTIFFLLFLGEAVTTPIYDDWTWLAPTVIGFILFAFIFFDYMPRLLGTHYPEKTIQICAPLTSPFLLLIFPFTYLFLKLSHSTSRMPYIDSSYELMGRDEIIDMLQHADLSPAFDMHDRTLIESVVQFKERIAREVMVPRVDVFSLSADTSIKQAAKLLQNEEYSRTPIYRNTVDNISGVLMYKDILRKYMEYEQKGNDPHILNAPIESIQKSVLHTPETKKLSSLLQEFRKKQVHLAIVVDEYGGTEGIVTIEDILEEIVGDISDEYDQQEEILFYRQPDGAWIVDARMNIIDAEEELGVEIPQEGEYDTIGGYIYHTTGSIPAKGFVIHHDQFDLEITKSNERSVEKVRIRPIVQDEEHSL